MFYAHGYDKGALVSRITIWSRIYQSSGKMKKELREMPSLRPEALYLWRMYCDIKKGCEAVGYEVIHSYSALKKVSLKNWEIDVILDIEKERCSNG